MAERLIGVSTSRENSVSTFRSFWTANEPGEVTLRLYLGSHNLSREEFLVQAQCRYYECRLHSDKVLFVKGTLWMDIVLPPSIFLVWQGFSERLIGVDIFSPDALLFMTLLRH